MYTNLKLFPDIDSDSNSKPPDDLQSIMGEYIDMVFDEAQKQGKPVLKVTQRNNHKWMETHQSPTPKSQYVNAQILKDWIKHLTGHLT